MKENAMLPRSTRRRVFSTLALVMGASLAGPPLAADSPGRGRTAQFETTYLKFIIDHHYSALRMTELAAGTDATRDPEISPTEGTSPSPGFDATSPRATLPEILSMARTANRMQREEILRAQTFLREWYGIDYQPRLRASGRAFIAVLEKAPAGRDFDRLFLQAFSRHHYEALHPTVDCLVDRELRHDQLERYCNGIVHAQTNEITDMRELLCREFDFCDFLPSDPEHGPDR